MTESTRIACAYVQLVSVALLVVVIKLTHIVDGPLVRILASSLVLKQREEEVLAQRRVRVEEDWPRGEDDINGVHILVRN